MNLFQTNVILCFGKKGKGPKTKLSSSKVLVLVKRRQISVGGLHRAKSPNPAQQSSLGEPVPNPLTLRLLRSPRWRVGWEVGVMKTVTQAD